MEQSLIYSEWAPLAFFNGIYEASTNGAFRTLETKYSMDGGKHWLVRKSVIKTARADKDNKIRLTKDGKTSSWPMDELILETFGFPRPSDKHLIVHKNGIPEDNRLCNIEWQHRDSPNESWLLVQGFEEYYELSNKGRLWAFDRVVTQSHKTQGTYERFVRGGFIKFQLDRKGYEFVRLWKNGKPHRSYVHQLVLRHFVGEPPNHESRFANHKNMNRVDNRVENLEWTTIADNNRHATTVGLQSKLNWKQVEEIKGLHEGGLSVAEIATNLKMSRQAIFYVVHETNWDIMHSSENERQITK